MCSLEEYCFIAVSTIHSSEVLNVIYKNCKYMHADEDMHILVYEFSHHISFLFITSDNAQYLSVSMFCPHTTNSLSVILYRSLCGSYQHHVGDVKHDSRASS